MSKKEGKTKVLLSFDNELLFDARKVLFKNNLTLQQYITFVMHKLSMEDPSAAELLDKAVAFQTQILESETKSNVLKINANNLYSLFEKEDEQRER